MVLANGSSPYPFYKLFAFCSPGVNGNHYALIDKAKNYLHDTIIKLQSENLFYGGPQLHFFFNEIFNSTQEDSRFEIS